MDKLNTSNFKRFYIVHYDRCFRFAKSYVHDDLVAQDIASEALIKLWELSEAEELEHPLRLLYVILKNKALDHLKHERIKQYALSVLSNQAKRELEIRISTLEAGNPDKVFAQDVKDILIDTFNLLPKQTQVIFELSRINNVPRKEIAHRFNISAKGVDYHIAKALSYLKKSLKDYFSILL